MYVIYMYVYIWCVPTKLNNIKLLTVNVALKHKIHIRKTLLKDSRTIELIRYILQWKRKRAKKQNSTRKTSTKKPNNKQPIKLKRKNFITLVENFHFKQLFYVYCICISQYVQLSYDTMEKRNMTILNVSTALLFF